MRKRTSPTKLSLPPDTECVQYAPAEAFLSPSRGMGDVQAEEIFREKGTFGRKLIPSLQGACLLRRGERERVSQGDEALEVLLEVWRGPRLRSGLRAKESKRVKNSVDPPGAAAKASGGGWGLSGGKKSGVLL